MNDHRNHRYRESEPAWPTGDNPSAHREEPPERTGFWSPLWEDDDEPARPANGHGGGHSARPRHEAASNGHSGGSHARRDEPSASPQWPDADAAPSGGGAGHRWPDAEPPAPPRPPAQPRPAPRSAGPVAWPGADAGAQAGRPGGPHTPPPGTPPPGVNGLPGGAPGARPPGAPGQTTRVVRPRPGGPGGPAGGPGGPAGPGRHGMAPPPGAVPDGPTELLPPVHRGNGPEPELLTHREPDYDEDVNDDPDLYYDEEEERPLSDTDRKRRRKKIWRRVRRTGYVLTALSIIGPFVGFFVAYQVVEVPDAKAVAADQGQVVTLTYSKASGGKQLSQIMPVDGLARKMVTYEELPDTVKHAVFAAEDAEFETNPGFDIGGVLRAGYNQVTGGAGGGSTITQQYIKQATGDAEASGLGGYTRKATEVVKAYKMNNTYTKKQILTSYLNTIYFGRSANGISAAAKAWFGVDDLAKLTPSQAALLAGMIQRPGQDSDSKEDVAYQKRRWKFVMDQMLDKNWITAEQRKTATFPKLVNKDKARPKAITGPGAHIQTAVLQEAKEAGYPLDKLRQKGYRIQTTIDQRGQKLMQESINEVMKGQPKELFPGMVAISPKDGSVLAYYGGKDGLGLDWAKARQEPGSSFKPFDLVALLETGKGLGETYDGRTDRIFDGRKVRNASGMSCGEKCTVALAMKKSINTVFYDIALNEVGTNKVAAAAKQAGVLSPLEGENGGAPDANISIGGGKTQVSTYEMASAYATFANGGIYHKPHLIEAILGPDGKTVWKPDQSTLDGKQAFDSDPSKNRQIARNVTESLLPIPEYSEIECDDGRLCAGKTGTHQFGATEDNAKAWMVGYTPQVSVAVSMAAEKGGKQQPLKNKDGGIVYGSGLPGEIWQTFMNKYLKGAEKMTFGQFEPIGKAASDENGDGENGDGDGDNNDDNPGNGNGDNNGNGNGNNDDDGDNPGNGQGTTTTQPTTTEPTETEPSTPTDSDGPLIPTIGDGRPGNEN